MSVDISVCELLRWDTKVGILPIAVGTQKTRLKPTVSFNVSGLCPTKMYRMWVKIVLRDNYNYKFDKDAGLFYGSSIENVKKYKEMYKEHSARAQLGSVWQNGPINFRDVFLSTRNTPINRAFSVETKRVYTVSLLITTDRFYHVYWFVDPLLTFVVTSLSSYTRMKPLLEQSSTLNAVEKENQELCATIPNQAPGINLEETEILSQPS
uniref:T-box domain-containing protein n=1 Tax=Caenorhabditis tropicalis TaxID=1561998 RepID=A0A1I7V3R9_9PELO